MNRARPKTHHSATWLKQHMSCPKKIYFFVSVYRKWYLGRGFVTVAHPNLTQTSSSVAIMAKSTQDCRPSLKDELCCMYKTIGKNGFDSIFSLYLSQSGSSRSWKHSLSPTTPQNRINPSRTKLRGFSGGTHSTNLR